MNIKNLALSILLGCNGMTLLSSPDASSYNISLNGAWEMGYQKIYSQHVNVPGIHTEASVMNPEKLWYRKEIILPGGSWKFATLQLKGARFAPEVFVNGTSVSKCNGGMAPTFHLLNNESSNGTGENLVPLVNAGKNLTRTPVIMVKTGKAKGNIIVSQLLTAGRLAEGPGEGGLYGIRYDPVAVQFVINMMEEIINK